MTGDRVSFHPEAATELHGGLAWYAARSTKVAGQFLVELDRALTVILESPRSWERVIGPWRRYPLRRFPFLIYFRETDSGIEIIAVAHGRRRPGYWQDRED
jgi:plasmid stabilization system protein ParE